MPDKEYIWSGVESSLRLMNQVFKPVLQLTQVLLDSQTDKTSEIPLKQIIAQALVQVAHSIDTRFDEK